METTPDTEYAKGWLWARKEMLEGNGFPDLSNPPSSTHPDDFIEGALAAIRCTADK